MTETTKAKSSRSLCHSDPIEPGTTSRRRPRPVAVRRLGRAITALRRPEGSLDWVEAGAEKMPLADDSFSVCWSLASVHHWPDLEGGLDEVGRVLEPGGLFIALERRSEPGATGNASHGWTPQQAELFASMLTERGYTDAVAADHDLGKRKVVTVTPRR
jgi:ubiquinone/menaquinone biosynthesis C-methylase UbiE